MNSHSTLTTGSRGQFDDDLEVLRAQIVLAATFPAAAQTLAALIYGVLPNVDVDDRGATYDFGSNLRVPISRFAQPEAGAKLQRGALAHAFAAYAFALGANYTIMDLFKSSNHVSRLTGIGRRVRNSIVRGQPDVSPDLLRDAADRGDVFLLTLGGREMGHRYAAAAEALLEVQQSGEDFSSRTGWIAEIAASLSWDVCPGLALSVIDRVIPPITSRCARERLGSRARIATILSRV